MQVTTALLADAAAVLNGKLYLHGGGWDSIYAAAFPTTQPAMALAFVFRVEYSEALVDIPFVIALVDEDENDAGPRFEGKLNVGHPPGMKAGTPLHIPQAMTLNMLQFSKPGQYRFTIRSGDKELASVPFRLGTLSPGMAGPIPLVPNG
ncbi:MAG: DUF6941 family protein [Candidatus Dormibacteria bacterium]